MKSILPMMIFLTACQDHSVEVQWFLGSWISDPDLTIAENHHLAGAEPDEIEAIRSILGEMRWEVTPGELKIILPNIGTETSYEYSLEDVTETSFYFSSERAGDMKIRKMGESICADFLNQPSDDPFLESECFARYDT